MATVDYIEKMAEVMFLEYQAQMAQQYPFVGRGKAFTWSQLPEITRTIWKSVAEKCYDEFNLAIVFDDR